MPGSATETPIDLQLNYFACDWLRLNWVAWLVKGFESNFEGQSCTKAQFSTDLVFELRLQCSIPA